MTQRDEDGLFHIWETASTALTFVDGRSQADLDKDPMLAYAIQQALLVIGETSARLSDQAKQHLPNVGWEGMMRMRDVIAEGEGDACNDTLWRVVRDELPRLAGELSPLVAAMEGRAREMPVATVKGRVLEQRLGVSREDVTELCRKHHIRRLAFFGSVLRDDFGDDSDVDVLVEFAPAHVPGLMGIVRMEDELSAMMGRKVDLRTPGDLNRRFRAEVIAAAEVWYDVA